MWWILYVKDQGCKNCASQCIQLKGLLSCFLNWFREFYTDCVVWPVIVILEISCGCSNHDFGDLMWLQQSRLWGSQVVATIVILGNSCGLCNHDFGELWRQISCNDFMLMPFAAIIILGSVEWSRDNDFLLCHLFHQMLHLKLLVGNTSTGGVSIYGSHHHVSTQVGACTYHYTQKRDVISGADVSLELPFCTCLLSYNFWWPNWLHLSIIQDAESDNDNRLPENSLHVFRLIHT